MSELITALLNLPLNCRSLSVQLEFGDADADEEEEEVEEQEEEGWYRLVSTYSAEKYHLGEWFLETPPLSKADATAIAKILNRRVGPSALRHWKVVKVGYELRPGSDRKQTGERENGHQGF